MADTASTGVVKVQDPSGNIVEVTQDEVPNLARAGYSPLTADQQAQITKQEKYSTVGQQAITALEGAAEIPTFGLSTGIETALGVPQEEIQARREINPGVHMLGQAAGFLIPGVGEAGLYGGIGRAATGVAGLSAEATGLGARIGYGAVKGAAETLLASGSDEVSKMFSGGQDPNAPLQSALVNMGLSGLIGGVIGGGIGAISPLWKATSGAKLQNAVTDMQNNVDNAAQNGIPLEGEEANQAGAQGAREALGRGSSSGQAGVPEALPEIQTEPLKNIPESSPGPFAKLREIAKNYSKESGIPFKQADEYMHVDPERGARIADAFENMKHDPADPTVKRAYQAMVDETLSQYQQVKKLGLNIEPITPDMENPYPLGSKQMIEDVKNGHLWYFPTEQGFGNGDITNNPLLAPTNEVSSNGKPMLANDVFRVVHDIFGHVKEGNSFGPSGEENAWQSHVRMYSPEAAKAMTTETRGQNSWVNYGPHGAENQANPGATMFAEQKTGLLPSWAMNEGMAADRDIPIEANPQNPYLKPNADSLAGSADRIPGFKKTVGLLSDSKFAQNLQDHLSHRPNPFGQAVAKETLNNKKALVNAAAETLEDATSKTKYEVGDIIDSGIQSKVQARYKPIKELYTKLEPHLKKMEVSSRLQEQAAEQVKNQIADAGGDAEDAHVVGLTNKLRGLKSVYDIKTFRTQIGNKLRDAFRGGYQGASEEIPILQATKSALTDMRESAIDEAAARTGIGHPEAGDISAQTIQELRKADAMYAAYKKDLSRLGVEAGLGNIESAGKLFAQSEKRSTESWATRIMDTGDLDQMNYFKEKYPQEFELARKYKLQTIAQKATSTAQGENGKLDLSKYLTQLDESKYGPEARKLLLNTPENLQKWNDIRDLYRASPGIMNPPNTAASIAWGDMFTPSGMISTANDAIKFGLLKSLPAIMDAAGTADSKIAGISALMHLKSGMAADADGFKGMIDYISQAVKGDNVMTQAVKNLFKGATLVAPQLLEPTPGEQEKLDRRLQSLQDNPTPLYSVGGKTAHYMPDHAQAFGQTAASAVNYLNGMRPQHARPSPLDKAVAPSKMETTAYEQALTIADKPLTVIKKIQQGTITPKDIEHLSTLYPALYQRLQQKVTHELMDSVHKEVNIPYKTRMGLSLFLAQPLDSTMQPNALQSIQNSYAPVVPMQAPQQQRRHKQGSMKNINKLADSNLTQSQARATQKQNTKI